MVERSACSIKWLSFDISDEVNGSVLKLKNLEDNMNLNIRSKLQFIVEQLQLAFMNIKHSSYSHDLLSIYVLWHNTYPVYIYKQIRDEDLLTVPSTRYIKELTSALSVETGLTENSIKYLKTRCQRLNNGKKNR